MGFRSDKPPKIARTSSAVRCPILSETALGGRAEKFSDNLTIRLGSWSDKRKILDLGWIKVVRSVKVDRSAECDIAAKKRTVLSLTGPFCQTDRSVIYRTVLSNRTVLSKWTVLSKRTVLSKGPFCQQDHSVNDRTVWLTERSGLQNGPVDRTVRLSIRHNFSK